MQRVARVMHLPPVFGACLMCRTGTIEDPGHFLLSCPALTSARASFHDSLASSLALAGHAGQILLASFRSASPAKALQMIAGCPVTLTCPPGTESGAHAEQCGKALFALDRVSKEYLTRCWRLRAAQVGSFSVAGGRLSVLSPPSPTREASPRVGQPIVSLEGRDWVPFIPKPPALPSAQRKGGRKGWHVVWRGRNPGLFYRWCDARDNIAGIDDALYKGYYNQDDAIAALANGGRD